MTTTKPALPEPVAWIVYTKDRKFVRACWTRPPDADQAAVAEVDGDVIAPCVEADQLRAYGDARAAAAKRADEVRDLLLEARDTLCSMPTAAYVDDLIRRIVAALQEQKS